jgi:hypothetical protein
LRKEKRFGRHYRGGFQASITPFAIVSVATKKQLSANFTNQSAEQFDSNTGIKRLAITINC